MRNYVLSPRDAEKFQEIVRWYNRHKNLRHRLRKRSTGIGGGGTAATDIKIFEVQSAATGDGVYNCYEQTIDKTEWDDTSGDDKFDDKNTTEVEILNLYENDPESSYKEGLAKYDRIIAWKKKDDEENDRWVGVPVAGAVVRRAITTQDAPADTKITANLYDNTDTEIESGLGSAIDVYCEIVGGGNLEDAVPLLKDDQDIFVINIQGKWWCTALFEIGATIALRRAKIQTGGVPSNNTGPFSCKLLDSGGLETGDAIDVYPCEHLGSNNFDGDVWPDLSAGDVVLVFQDLDSNWYIANIIFDDTESCA